MSNREDLAEYRIAPLTPVERVLMGPGPSDVPPSVLEAMALPTIGHLDPAFLRIMDEIRDMLRRVFGTENRLTLPMSGTGSAGMETCMVNLIRPGDRVIVGVNGVFGTRMVEVARRCGAEVDIVKAPWGKAFTPDDFRGAGNGAYRLMALVHAETSTGVLQDLSGMREVADELGALLMIDAVTSIGGSPIDLDRMGVDAAYAGTQKCLSCPPGLAPVSFSERAETRITSRDAPAQSWYLDLALIGKYWGSERTYHHTAPINMLYGLHTALRETLEEGLEARFERHQKHGRALWAGLTAMGLNLLVDEAERLPQLTLVEIPEGIDDRAVRMHLLERRNLEIGGGLGEFAQKAWRIGLMGASSTPRHITSCLSALSDALRAQGYTVKGEPLRAAQQALQTVETA